MVHIIQSGAKVLFLMKMEGVLEKKGGFFEC